MSSDASANVTAAAAVACAAGSARSRAWGTTWRQRLRLAPLYASLELADALASRLALPPPTREGTGWRAGVSVVIPERDAPDLLSAALDSANAALAATHEPHEIVVVVNGSRPERYAVLRARHPAMRVVERAEPLGFSAAVSAGLELARHDWTFLMNNDVTLDADAIARVMRCRAPDVFAVGAQIVQKSASGRREETGLVDWYIDRDGVHVYHADPGTSRDTRRGLCASGGAALFRTSLLRAYAASSRCYDPFYWEDVEWGVRAADDGFRVLFCPDAIAFHRRRATTARFYGDAELERIVERNRLLFEMRNAASGASAASFLARICDAPYATQRELAHASVPFALARRRVAARRARRVPIAPSLAADATGIVDITRSSHAYRLRNAEPALPPARTRLLVVSPFAVYPPQHGGARRIAGLLRALRRDYDIVLVSDEASLYDARSFVHFDELCAVHLVQRAAAHTARIATSLESRVADHCHETLRAALVRALARYRPAIVQIEHAELAPLVDLRGAEAWVLSLHDAVNAADFASAAAAARFERDVLARYDAVSVCCEDDARLVAHPRVACVPNGTDLPTEPYRVSTGRELLFIGPFRYAPNFDGIRAFLARAWPVVQKAVPDATLAILGGDGATRRAAAHREFAQDGVRVYEHRDDVARFLAESALTVNPLAAIRGSAIKLIESLRAGRVCVSTTDGARGFSGGHCAALVEVASIDAMAPPIVRLLLDNAERRRLEAPDARLAAFDWERCADRARELYDSLLDRADARDGGTTASAALA